MRYLVIAFILSLGACSAQKPVPVDRFYRLPDITMNENDRVNLKSEVIYVRIFETDGLHRERALVYSKEDSSLELKQYHYQHWIDSPTRMLRDHLVQYLRAIDTSASVVTSVDPYPQLEIKGRIKRFDQVNSEAGREVFVTLELRADRDGRLVHVGDYSVSEKINSTETSDVVMVYGDLLLTCFRQFVADVKTEI